MIRILMMLSAKWRIVLPAIGGGLLVAFIGWNLHQWHVGLIEAKYQQDLERHTALLVEECDKDKQITEEVSSAYQKTITDLNNRVSDLKRMQPKTCVPVSVTDTPGGHNATSADYRLPTAHGITYDALLEYASDAEKVGLRLDACQTFIRRTWRAKNPAK